jgi:hypothetical protein
VVAVGAAGVPRIVVESAVVCNIMHLFMVSLCELTRQGSGHTTASDS